MAKPFEQIPGHLLYSTHVALAKAGGDETHAAWIRSGDNAEVLIRFIEEKKGRLERNPFEQTVEQQLASLRKANDEECGLNPHWERIQEEVFARLAATAPPWPLGLHVYRSLRIRFGEGEEGVRQTFNAHEMRFHSTFGQSRFWKFRYCNRMTLLNGSHTHRGVIEWVKADLGVNRTRESIKSVRSENSMADELLTLAWLFPDMIKAIDGKVLPSLVLAGYQFGGSPASRHMVPVIRKNIVDRQDNPHKDVQLGLVRQVDKRGQGSSIPELFT
ncbi:MAG: hypothetical protein WC551_00985 [Patescibacteria group bacterium]